MKVLANLTKTIKSRSGQSIVELSLVTPLLLVMLYIPVDFGIAFFVANIAGTAARDGARIASQSGKSAGDADNRNFADNDAGAVKDNMLPMLPAYLTNRSIRVQFFEDTVPNCLEVVEVTVSGDYNYFFYQILRLFGATVPNSSTISRTTQMPYRYQPYQNHDRCTTSSVNELYSSL